MRAARGKTGVGAAVTAKMGEAELHAGAEVQLSMLPPEVGAAGAGEVPDEWRRGPGRPRGSLTTNYDRIVQAGRL